MNNILDIKLRKCINSVSADKTKPRAKDGCALSQARPSSEVRDNKMRNTEDREWVRLGEATKLTGLNRNKLYDLMNSGAVKYAEIKEKHATRGVRLLHYPSLTSYIDSCVIEVENGELS